MDYEIHFDNSNDQHDDPYGDSGSQSNNKNTKEKIDERICLRHACTSLITAHSNSFVLCTFRSLHLKYPVHSGDVDIAVKLCQNTTVSIDITKYIKVGPPFFYLARLERPVSIYLFPSRDWDMKTAWEL